MRFLLLIVTLSFLVACSNDSAISKQLSGSDSLVIHFTAAPSDSIIKTVVTAEPNAIKKIIQFVDAKKAAEYKCGYDGQLIFFSKGQEINDASFKYTEEDCRHFLLEVDGKLYSTSMNNEAYNFLKGLAEGKNWY